jgi:DNA polymerase-3 subunit beta
VRYRRNDLKSNKGTDFIVPRKALNLLKGLLSGGSFEVGVNFNTTNAQFDLGNTKLTCRLIDEKFPLYEAAIPTTAPIKMTIDRSAMLGSLKRILIYANRSTNQTRLKIMDNQLTVSAEDLDFEHDAKEQLTCEHIGEDIEIGFNGRFLIEVLNNIDSEKVTFNMSEPNKAALITPSDKVGDDDLLMLVMPVMLIRYA